VQQWTVAASKVTCNIQPCRWWFSIAGAYMVCRYRNGQSVPLLKPRERYSSAMLSFILNLREARSREGQKQIGDRTESVK
jgi:hypothetical protein